MSHRPEPARPEDLDALVELENEVFSVDRVSRRAWRHLLGRAHGRVLVVRGAGPDDPPLLGAAVILFRRGAGVARLYSLAVAPRARGRGVGRGLLDAALGLAAAAGGERLGLEVRADNRTALALYREAGFRPVRDLPGYYVDGGAGVRMERPLDDVPAGPWKHLFRLA
jgi:ribosomal protein S18 acetylase RimI-like enzyme